MVRKLFLTLLLVVGLLSPCYAADLNKWNGITLGSSTGNINKIDGYTWGTASGNYTKWDALNATSGVTAPVLVNAKIGTGYLSQTVQSGAFKVTTGHALIVFISNYTDPAYRNVSTVVDSTGANTYTYLTSVVTSTTIKVEAWYCLNVTGASNLNITVTFDNSASYCGVSVGHYARTTAIGTSASEYSSASISGTTQVTLPNITTTQDIETLVCGVYLTSFTAATPGVNYTKRMDAVDFAPATPIAPSIMDRSTTSVGNYNATATFASSYGAAILVSIYGTSSVSEGCPEYLLCQNFEGTGYDNGESWATGGSGTYTIDPDNTTAPILKGSQQVRINAGSSFGVLSSPTFAQTAIVYFRSKVRFSLLPVADSNIFWLRTAGDANVITVGLKSDGKLFLTVKDVAQVATNDSVSADTIYYIWVRTSSISPYTVSMAFSTDTTEPTSGTKFISANFLQAWVIQNIRAWAWFETIVSDFDEVIVSANPITASVVP